MPSTVYCLPGLLPHAAVPIPGLLLCAPLFWGAACRKFLLQFLEFVGSFLGCGASRIYFCLFGGYLLRQFSHNVTVERFASLLDLEQV